MTNTPQVPSEEIISVHRYCREDDGSVCVRCPHCGWTIGLERGPFKGEQYQHKPCGGWLEVDIEARFVETSEELAATGAHHE